jgi:hypothetical protein
MDFVRRRPSATLLLLAAVTALAAAPAAAAVVEETTVEEVARTSETVVRGRVERLSPRWSRDGRRILTDVDIIVDGRWKGSAPDRLRVVVPGGRVGDLAQRVDAAPVFAEREDVVVFLGRRGGAWRITGLALGKYRVDGKTARPTLDEVHVSPRPTPAGERAVGAMPLVELERRVRGTR